VSEDRWGPRTTFAWHPGPYTHPGARRPKTYDWPRRDTVQSLADLTPLLGFDSRGSIGLEDRAALLRGTGDAGTTGGQIMDCWSHSKL
jgi:hypothetical protein